MRPKKPRARTALPGAAAASRNPSAGARTRTARAGTGRGEVGRILSSPPMAGSSFAPSTPSATSRARDDRTSGSAAAASTEAPAADSSTATTWAAPAATSSPPPARAGSSAAAPLCIASRRTRGSSRRPRATTGPRRPRRGPPSTISACAPTTTSEKSAKASREARFPTASPGNGSCAAGRLFAASRPPARSTGTTTTLPASAPGSRLAARRVAARAAVASTPRTAATTLILGPGLLPTMTQAGTARAAALDARPRAGGASGILTARASPGATETPPTLRPRAGNSTAIARPRNPDPPGRRSRGAWPQYSHSRRPHPLQIPDMWGQIDLFAAVAGTIRRGSFHGSFFDDRA